MQLRHKHPASGLPAVGRRAAVGLKRAPDDTVPNHQGGEGEGFMRRRAAATTQTTTVQPTHDTSENILNAMTSVTQIQISFAVRFRSELVKAYIDHGCFSSS